MAFDFGIKAVFGADTGQLKADLVKAQGSLKEFKNTAEGMGLDLRKLALSTIFIGIGHAITQVIDNAQKMRDEFEKMGKPLDASVKRVAEFGDAIDGMKKAVVSASIEAVSFINLAGEGWGSFINRLKGVSLESEKASVGIAKAADKAVASIEAAAAAMPERMRKANEALDKSQAALFDATAKNYDKLMRYEQEYAQAMQLRNSFGEGSVAWTEAAVKANEAGLKVVKQRAEYEKEIAANVEKELKDFYGSIDAKKEVVAAASAQLQVEEAITNEIENQVDAEKDLGREKANTAGIAGVGTTASFGDASDSALQEKLRRNENEIARLRNPANWGAGSGLAQALEAGRIGAENMNIRQELNLRSEVRGAGGNVSNFKGDPLLFDNLTHMFDQNKTETRETNELLKTTNDLLRGKFRNV
jgi:hypothetical protein